MKLQEYFNTQYPKSLQVISWEVNNAKLGGRELIIEDYHNLESIVIEDLPQLKTLTIKNCAKLTGLELDLNQNIEVSLIGDFPLLKSYKIKQTEKQPTFIYKNEDKGFC